MSTPTLVFATQHLPCASQTYGAQLRAFHIAKALQGFANLKLWVFPYAMVSQKDLQQTEETFGSTRIAVCDQPSPRSFSKTLSEHLNPCCAKIGRAFPSENDQQDFLTDADNATAVWLHGLVIPNLFGRKVWPNTVIDIDDLRSQVWMGKHREASGKKEKLRTRHQVNLWKKRERALPQRFPSITVCSEDDRNYLGLPEPKAPLVIPNGFEAPKETVPRTARDSKRIGFIGTFNYQPNSKGVAWFLEKVWPKILAQVPEATFRIVGSATEQLDDPEYRVNGLGFVDDTDAEMATWSCSIVPILVGGGTRIKIAEAFSKRCPVVSTSLGAHGYRATDRNQLRLSDDADSFANACIELLLQPEIGEEMAERAFQEFEKRWDWNSIQPESLRPPNSP